MDLSTLTLDDITIQLAHHLWSIDDRTTYKAIQRILISGLAHNQFLTLNQLQFIHYFDCNTGELNKYKYGALNMPAIK